MVPSEPWRKIREHGRAAGRDRLECQVRSAIGLDFGTTNSSIALAQRDGSSVLAGFADGDRQTTTFRSVLYFSTESEIRNRRPTVVAGPQAIRSYLEAALSGRFIQSLKSHLASRLFEETYILSWKYTLEDLVAIILGELREAAESQFGRVSRNVLLGRPVHFASGADGTADEEADAFALRRLSSAAEKAGFEEIAFELEPVAAAHEYERSLDHDELVLIGDFGGGTSDFCLVELGPTAGAAEDRSTRILGVDGVAIAGGAFDAKLVRRVVAPKLGLGSSRRSELGKLLPVPAWIYGKLERWEDLSFLKNRETMSTLTQIRFQALEPRKIDSLIRLVEDDLGYTLYQAVERTKLELSEVTESRFLFNELPMRIEHKVQRAEFETMIEAELTAIAACVDKLLERCNVVGSDVDRVFLTGGSSLTPAVRALFEARFGENRLSSGEALTTVARGLALIAAEV